MDGYYNIIEFVVADRAIQGGIEGESNSVYRALRLELEGDFVWRAGMEASVYSFRCPYDEFEKLGGNADREGELRFYYSRSAGLPDWRIKRMRIIDVVPLQIGLGADQKRRIIDYRILIADMREGWVWPRGGNLRVLWDYGDEDPAYSSKVNPKEVPAERHKDNSVLMEACLVMMGVKLYSIDLAVDNVPPIRDLEWRGNHAPTELAKLLEHCGAVLALDSSGMVRIVPIGSGLAPTVPEGQRLGDDLVLPSIDRRPPTVIVTSEPSAVINTATVKGPSSATWQFVAQHGNGTWKPQDQLYELLGGMTPAEMVRDHFMNAPAMHRERMRRQFFRFIRLRTDSKRMRMLRSLYTKDDAGVIGPRPVAVVARVAVVGQDGTFVNETMDCGAAYLHYGNEKGVPFPIIQVSQRLGRVRVDGVDDPDAEFVELAADDMTVQFSHEVIEEFEASAGKASAGKAAAGKAAAAYYQAGYRWDGKAAVKLSDGDLRNALAGGRDAWVIQRPELVEYRLDGEPLNRDELDEMAVRIAAVHLRGALAGEAKLTSVMGWCSAELSGLVSEIKLSQRPPAMWIRQNTWFAPSSSVRMDLWRKERKAAEAYPGQLATAGTAVAQGADAAKQPVVPLMPSTQGGGGADSLVIVKITGTGQGGKYTGQIGRGRSTAATAGQLAMPVGMTFDETGTCLVLDLDEDGLPTHWIQVGACVPGKIVGRTAGTPGVPIVMISGGLARTANAQTLPGTGEGTDTPDTATWSRGAAGAGTSYGDCPVSVPVTTRVVYDPAVGKRVLYGMQRWLTYSARGELVAVSAETRYEVDVTAPCVVTP